MKQGISLFNWGSSFVLHVSCTVKYKLSHSSIILYRNVFSSKLFCRISFLVDPVMGIYTIEILLK